jgi:hypothetical protein
LKIGSHKLFAWPWIMSHLMSTSQAARITCVSHQCLASVCTVLREYTCTSGLVHSWEVGLIPGARVKVMAPYRRVSLVAKLEPALVLCPVLWDPFTQVSERALRKLVPVKPHM